MCKYLSTSQAREDLILHKTISDTKFAVLLAKSSLDSTEYIIKTFTKDDASLSSYLREKQVLSSLSHSNIINYISNSHFHVDIPHSSYILMEYAPYGDFFNLLIQNNLPNEKLIRTYFHHLIEGLDYLHSQEIAHLDVKLENLLLGKDCLLKIADFDVAQNVNDDVLFSQGTENYRAPEILMEDCQNYQAADVYSAGICLFVLLAKTFPFLEAGSQYSNEFQNYKRFIVNPEKFWNRMERFLKNKIHFSQNLRELFHGMWNLDVKKRFDLNQIKQSRWYNESIYSNEELKVIMENKLIN